MVLNTTMKHIPPIKAKAKPVLASFFSPQMMLPHPIEPLNANCTHKSYAKRSFARLQCQVL